MRSCHLIVASLVLALPASQLLAKPLPSDSRVLKGKMENGVKWMYRQHDNPPGKMALMIHIDTGSLNEKDSQRGLAHFLEHMCFNGTENFAPGELIPYFESIGMEFGADLNAFTSFDQTAYMLFTPDTEEAQIDKALMVLSDYAFRATLPIEEINKERGVVLEEARRGKSAFQRIRDKLWPELFENTRFAVRLPIGDEDVIANASREEFVDYYQTWYRPENTTVVLVGDAEADRIVPLIKKWFGKAKGKGKTRPQKGPEFKPFTKQRAMVVTDPEMAMCSVQMTDIRSGRPPTTTYEQARVQLTEYFGSWIIGRRYDELVNKGEAAFRGAGASVSDFFHDAMLVSGSASGEPQDWSKMLEQLIVEISRAREHGFSQRELSLAKEAIIASAERGVRTEPTRNARGIVQGIVRTVNGHEPYSSAQQDLDVYNELLPKITLTDVNEAFTRNFTPGKFAYIIQAPDKDGVVVPAREEVLAAARAAWSRKTKPLETTDAPTELLAKLPMPGKTIDKSEFEPLEVTNAWLSNGVRVHHRFMDYKKDSVMISISLAGGTIEETADNVGITQVASLAFQEAATSRLTSTNIRDIMTGKNIGVRGGGREDAFTISVSGSPEDLEIGLQKAYALLTDGKIEESAFDNWKLRMLQQIEMMDRNPSMMAFKAMHEMLTGGDTRTPFLTKENIESLKLADAQLWLNRLCKTAPIEVAVVGEMKLDAVMPLIEKYIGSLPKRERSAKYLDGLRKLARPTGPLSRHITVDTVTPQAMAIAGFVGCESRNSVDRRALQIASQILTSRLVKRIREELGIVYSIRCGSSASKAYEDAGRFSAGASCDPENAPKVIEEVHAIFADFRDNGMTDEELENAKKQIANNLDTSMREPRFWWSILGDLDYHHRDLADTYRAKEAYAAFSKDKVHGVFKKYYTPERTFGVSAVPAPPKTPIDAPNKEGSTSPSPS